MNCYDESRYAEALESPLWDADPTVCCAAAQLGACPHSEDAAYEAALEDEAEARPVAPAPATPPVGVEDDEPF